MLERAASRKGSVGEKPQLVALGMARALVRHHVEDILPHLRQLVLAVVPAVEDQRLAVVKTAICLFKASRHHLLCGHHRHQD